MRDAMIVSVTITFSIPASEKHQRQMQQAAEALTDSKSSVHVSQAAGDSKRLTARFTVPKARQADIVDHIGRKFWDYIEDYCDSSIRFSSGSR
jgi:hypothetical protein